MGSARIWWLAIAGPAQIVGTWIALSFVLKAKWTARTGKKLDEGLRSLDFDD